LKNKCGRCNTLEDLKKKVKKIEEMVTTLYEEKNDTSNSIVLMKTIDNAGRVTIPKAFRAALGIENTTAEIQMELNGKSIILTIKDESVGE
jgi:DNA-binding transcriptional regulator/RsmH inhibitor MraZ